MFWDFFQKKEPKYSTIPSSDNCASFGVLQSDQKQTADFHTKIWVSVATNPGLIREENEDDFFISGVGCKPASNYSFETHLDVSELQLFAVFDGMGGEAYGAEASALAAQALQEIGCTLQQADTENLELFMRDYTNLANSRINKMVVEKQCGRSGSTVALVIIYNGTAHVFNVGDSRVYCYDGRHIRQITEDQTLAMKKLKANIYTKKEAMESEDAHKITSYLGVDERGVGVSYLSYAPFDMENQFLLICSDGLTDMCSDEEITEIVSVKQDDAAKKLVEKALQNGGEDNVTCIVIRYV